MVLQKLHRAARRTFERGGEERRLLFAEQRIVVRKGGNDLQKHRQRRRLDVIDAQRLQAEQHLHALVAQQPAAQVVGKLGLLAPEQLRPQQRKGRSVLHKGEKRVDALHGEGKAAAVGDHDGVQTVFLVIFMGQVVNERVQAGVGGVVAVIVEQIAVAQAEMCLGRFHAGFCGAFLRKGEQILADHGSGSLHGVRALRCAGSLFLFVAAALQIELLDAAFRVQPVGHAVQQQPSAGFGIAQRLVMLQRDAEIVAQHVQ